MKKEKIYQGSGKTIYALEEDNKMLLSFEDGLRLNSENKIEISGKGVLCNSISAYLMEKLDMVGIENHLIEKKNMRQQIIQIVDMYPLQVRISNIASDRYISDFGMEAGYSFDEPMIDFRVKNSELHYPIINEYQIKKFGWLTGYEIKDLKRQTIRVNDFLSGLYAGIGIRFIEAKLEFGRVWNGEDFCTMLADDISPDNCKLWDIETNRKLSHELASDNPDELIDGYKEISKRLGVK